MNEIRKGFCNGKPGRWHKEKWQKYYLAMFFFRGKYNQPKIYFRVKM